MGNQLGTISLFSCEPVLHQYEATRVQQFFMYDRRSSNQHGNPFEKIENRPQICGYNMIPHESQSGKPLIGKFASDVIASITDPAVAHQIALAGGGSSAVAPRDADDEDEESKDEGLQAHHELQAARKAELLMKKKAESRTFERKLLTAKELGLLEEKYYEH